MIQIKINKCSSYDRVHSTVVPALGDPRREQTPAMYGHVINVPTHFNVKLPAIGGHLPNADADSHLLVVRTCYNGQFKQMPCFRRSFQPKIAGGGHPNLRPTFHIEGKRHHVVKVTYSMLNPRCWRRERFLVFTNAHHVERLPSSWCVKMQIARI